MAGRGQIRARKLVNRCHAYSNSVTTGRYLALKINGSSPAANLRDSISARCPLLPLGVFQPTEAMQRKLSFAVTGSTLAPGHEWSIEVLKEGFSADRVDH